MSPCPHCRGDGSREKDLEALIMKVGRWLKDMHRMRSKAFTAFKGNTHAATLERAKLEAQTHLLAQIHLVMSGQLWLLNQRTKPPLP